MRIKNWSTRLDLFDCHNEWAKDFVDFDQKAGEFTRDSWVDYLLERGLTADEVEQVCDVLEGTSNVAFFKTEEGE